MSKRTQPKAPPDITFRPQEHIVTQEREYSLITPLFGGGAIAGERDEVTVVRGTEIRGHLRFWWRACYGGRYSTVKEMKQAEDRIWGAASQPEKDEKERADAEQGNKEKKPAKTTAQIIVKVTNEGREVEPFPVRAAKEYAEKTGKDNSRRKNYWESRYERTSGIPEYAAFTLQLSSDEKEKPERPDKRLVYAGVEFTLTISFSKEMQADIEGALWAWETFGGVGARTRRGFGALRLRKIDGKDNIDVPTSNNAVQWIRKHIVDLHSRSEPPVKGKAPENVPCLLPTMSIRSIGPYQGAQQAWEEIIKRLSKYRQYPNGRIPKYGASKWPEADTIRALTHKRGPYPSSAMPQKFPRAAFGLPIIFNFIGRPDLQKRPLQGKNKNHDRLASPLILRPLICKDNTMNKAIGLAIVLENFSFPPEGIVFIEKNGTPHLVDPHIKKDEVYRIEPLSEANVLHAFMNYFGGNQ